MSTRVVAAVDIGASGGRVMTGSLSHDELQLAEVHRFDHAAAVGPDGHLRWDLDRLGEQMEVGLARVVRRTPEVESVGIDTWAVDYALFDERGAVVDGPISYRDGRTEPEIDRVHELVPPDELYAMNGLQHLPFTTIYQLAADRSTNRWHGAAHALLLPDALAHRLTGQLATEVTNASTTGLLDVRTSTWCEPLMDRLGVPVGLFPDLQMPGTTRGPLDPAAADRIGCTTPLLVTNVGSHDTASAVVGVPATADEFAYVSCGTWSLVGMELDRPVLSEDARLANFTNELGVDGRVRFLRNVGGLWLLEECRRTWADEGLRLPLDDLLVRAAAVPAGGPTVDVDSPDFIAPGDMPRRLVAAVEAAGQHLDDDPARITRCVLDSLAIAYAATVRRAEELTGRVVRVIHLVGGGSRNELLCELTAAAAGLPVLAGPAEATAWGNLLVQARAIGALDGSLDSLRARLAASVSLRRYEP
jgi:rhamnulokinase